MHPNVQVSPGSRLSALHDGAASTIEHTTCNYGLDPAVQTIAATYGMTISGIDETGEVRAIERPDHPFFVATLYQPQLNSTPDTPHPILSGLVAAAMV